MAQDDEPRAGPRRGRARALVAWVLIPAALGALVLVQAGLIRAATSATIDEVFYLDVGMWVLHRGDFSALGGMNVPPLPILLEYGPPALRTAADPGAASRESELPGLIGEARLATTVLVGVPLVLVVYAWLAARRGWPAGALGGALTALSPNVVAFASLATTDACFVLFALLGLAAMQRYLAGPSPRRFAAMAAGAGLALAAKPSAVFLFPVALAMFLVAARRREAGLSGPGVLAGLAGRLAALVVLAFAVAWGVSGFAAAPPHLWRPRGLAPLVPLIVSELAPGGRSIRAFAERLPFPLAVDSVLGQWDHMQRGHPAFLMGRRSSSGWWWYFPAALALKSTPAELAMLLSAALLATRRRAWSDPARRLWLTSLAVFLGAAALCSLNLGVRYVLLVYPLATLLAVDALADRGGRRPARVLAAGGLLLAAQGVEAARIAPHDLAYFNGLCGGPAEGYRYLVDSNLDWGQDLPALRARLTALGYRKVALASYGNAPPRAYGLRSQPWDAPGDPVASGCDWLAISATKLQGVRMERPATFAPFHRLPAVRAGYSMFLYDLKDPRVRRALAAARDPLGPGR